MYKFRKFFTLCLLVISAPLVANAATTYATFAELPVAPAAGTLGWILDGNGTTTSGAVCAGTGVGTHLCAYDGANWVFVQEGTPVTPPGAEPETFLGAVQVAYDSAVSGLAATTTQAAIDELDANGVGFAPNVSPSTDHSSFDAEVDARIALGPSGGHVIEDEGIPLAAEANLNFTGTGVTCAAGTGETICDIPSVGGASALSDLTDVTSTAGAATGTVLRKTAGNWEHGQLDLANAAAVTGVLPDANVATTLSRDSELAAHAALADEHHNANAIGEGNVGVAADDPGTGFITFTVETENLLWNAVGNVFTITSSTLVDTFDMVMGLQADTVTASSAAPLVVLDDTDEAGGVPAVEWSATSLAGDDTLSSIRIERNGAYQTYFSWDTSGAGLTTIGDGQAGEVLNLDAPIVEVFGILRADGVEIDSVDGANGITIPVNTIARVCQAGTDEADIYMSTVGGLNDELLTCDDLGDERALVRYGRLGEGTPDPRLTLQGAENSTTLEIRMHSTAANTTHGMAQYNHLGNKTTYTKRGGSFVAQAFKHLDSASQFEGADLAFRKDTAVSGEGYDSVLLRSIGYGLAETRIDIDSVGPILIQSADSGLNDTPATSGEGVAICDANNSDCTLLQTADGASAANALNITGTATFPAGGGTVAYNEDLASECFDLRVVNEVAADPVTGLNGVNLFVTKRPYPFTVTSVQCGTHGTGAHAVTFALAECDATGGTCGAGFGAVDCDGDYQGSTPNELIDANDVLWSTLSGGAGTTLLDVTVTVCGTRTIN